MSQYNDKRMMSYFDAVSLSYLAHRGQTRRDLSIPYWVHVALVSATVAEWGGDPDQVEAALIHDVIEDTDLTADAVKVLTGAAVTDIVNGMTASKNDTYTWKERKEMYIADFALEAVDAKCYLVKLADMYCNMTSFCNTMVRTGKSTAKAKTIDSYVVLSHICLYLLRRYGTPQQFNVARFHMERMFGQVKEIELCPKAELLKEINFMQLETPEFWTERLQKYWLTN